MNLLNATAMRAMFTLGRDPDGREHVVIVTKGTFVIPSNGGVAALAEVQDDFVFADTFTGKPGFSAVLEECDFAPFKPRCDVLVVGTAYAPRGRTAKSVLVELCVGAMRKELEVVGDRHWTSGFAPSSPRPFASVPITYDRAFGGPGEISEENPAVSDAYAPNPVGVGYFARPRDEHVFSRPLPNTQVPDDPVTSPKGRYQPMSFGPIGRNFAPRYALAGTYDQVWVDEVFPFLPADFKVDYYQAAPADQQIVYPEGGEVVQLAGLTPDVLPPFQLPAIDLPVELTRASLARAQTSAVLDTIVLHPDRMRMHLVWRASFPLERNLQEVRQLIVGLMPRNWYRARARGKEYYPSLGALATATMAARS